MPPRNPGERGAPDEAMVPPWNGTPAGKALLMRLWCRPGTPAGKAPPMRLWCRPGNPVSRTPLMRLRSRQRSREKRQGVFPSRDRMPEGEGATTQKGAGS